MIDAGPYTTENGVVFPFDVVAISVGPNTTGIVLPPTETFTLIGIVVELKRTDALAPTVPPALTLPEKVPAIPPEAAAVQQHGSLALADGDRAERDREVRESELGDWRDRASRSRWRSSARASRRR